MRSTPLFVAVIVSLASTSCARAAKAPAPVAPASSSATAGAASIGALQKTHDLDVGNRSMGMRIMVPVELVGVTGRTVAAVLWFYDASGEPIRSAVAGWGDATNHLRIIGRDVVPTLARQSFHFDFQVPYGAFPRRTGGRYQVEARAVLAERVGDGRVVLARRSTTFFVE